MFRFVTPALLFAAFVLLLLASISVPIIKSVYILDVHAHAGSSFGSISGNGDIRFGVWGYCVSAITATGFGITRTQPGKCSPKKLGYKFDSQLLSLTGLHDLENIIVKPLTAVLVLHPVACALTFLAFLLSLHAVVRVHRVTSLLTTVLASLAAILTTLVFLIDIILAAVAKSRVRKATSGRISIGFGNAIWMTLGATIALWAATVGACAGVVAIRRRQKTQHY